MKYIRKFDSYSDAKSSILVSPTLATFGADSEKVYMKNIYDELNYKIIGNLDNSDIALTVEWLVETTKEDKVKIAGNCILNKKVDVYSIEFLEGAHLTIGYGGRLRIWEGGIINSDVETTNYFTLLYSEIDNNYRTSELMLHPAIIENYNVLVTAIYTADLGRIAGTATYKHGHFTNVISDIKTFTREPYAVVYIYKWDQTKLDWTNITSFLEMNSLAGLWSINEDRQLIKFTITGILFNSLTINATIENSNIVVPTIWAGNTKIGPLFDLFNSNGINTLAYVYKGSISVIINKDNILQYYDTYVLAGILHICTTNIYTATITMNYKELIWDPSFIESSNIVLPILASNTPKFASKAINDNKIINALTCKNLGNGIS